MQLILFIYLFGTKEEKSFFSGFHVYNLFKLDQSSGQVRKAGSGFGFKYTKPYTQIHVADFVLPKSQTPTELKEEVVKTALASQVWLSLPQFFAVPPCQSCHFPFLTCSEALGTFFPAAQVTTSVCTPKNSSLHVPKSPFKLY